ncbi:MAG: tetratricopeptide repeat protein [Betaproteobacteria bacterium]|nr:tetratricopeptide repeat protein [Betaproteobacteria bacterium]
MSLSGWIRDRLFSGRDGAAPDRATSLDDSGGTPHADARNAELKRAIDLHEAGDLAAAEACYRDILERDPGNARALHLRGLVAHQRDNQPNALALIEQAIAIDATDALFHFNRANVLLAMNQVEPALAACRAALNLRPHYPAALFNMARILEQTGDATASMGALVRVLEIEPSLPGAWEALAARLIAHGEERLKNRSTPQDQTALAVLRATWSAAADPLEARFMLGYLLQQRTHWSEAVSHYEAVLAQRPGLWTARNNLGNCLNQLGRMDEAVAQYRAAMALNPDLPDIASGICSGVNYDPRCSPGEVFLEHRNWTLSFARRHYPGVLTWPNDRNPEKRLRIGYLSPDFCRHPVSNLFAPVAERHDRNAVEVFCYYNFGRNDAMTDRLRSKADTWRVIVGLSDEEVAARIRADGIDILVDLAGHTSQHRLLVLARRPAPVQASWLGYFTTTGLNTVDYFVTDPHSSPEGQDAWFTEKLVRLPHTRFCYEPWEGMPEANPLPAEMRGAITFGSLNNLAKLNRDVLELWGRVVAAVPRSRLLLQAHGLGDAANRERVSELAADAGLPADRLDLRPFEFMQVGSSAYHDIDIALDPFPFCGGLSSFDALWMGVPVVTLPQQLIAGRQTTGMLANLGMQELIARDAADYVRIAAELAADHARLAAYRAGLRNRFRASPLADYAVFTKNLERAYRTMWRAWVADGPKEAITL